VVLAQQSVGRITVAVDDAVEKAPAAAILQVGLVGMPRSATSSMFTPTALPELGSQNGCELRLPIAQRPMAEYDAALQEYLAEVRRCGAMAQAPEYGQGNDVTRILGSVQHATAALTELRTTMMSAEAPVAPRVRSRCSELARQP
jgi:hypothetical protein